MWEYNYSQSSDEFYHHGIKGMRWGVRRFQNADGSLTNAGRKRYLNDPSVQKSRSEFDSAKAKQKTARNATIKAYSKYFFIPTTKNYREYLNANDKSGRANSSHKRAKFDYETKKEVARLKENGTQFTNKSKHRLKLEEQYQKMGLSKEEAQAAANNRIRTEKLLAASAAVAVTACAAYVANKQLKSRVDSVIKAGESMQRIERQDTGGKLYDVAYMAKGKHDTKRYAGLLGMTRKQQTGHAYVMKLEASKDIKVASKDNAAKIFGDLYKNDPDFRKVAEQYTRQHFTGKNVLNTSDLSKKNIKKMYENFNANLINARVDGTGVDKKFYSKLKDAGYGAIQDINDMKYSGYNAKNPLIVFDNAGTNIMVKSVSEMTGNLNKSGTSEFRKAAGEQAAKKFIETVGPLSAAGLTTAAVGTYVSKPDENLVKKK